ncbi:MAG: serine/threonine-protein kinase [Planctomycetota bacterium]
MPPPRDDEFLAQLVQRGRLGVESARELAARVAAGEALDPLLEAALGVDAKDVARLRRTRAGEIPEIPGFDVRERIGTGGTADVWRALDRREGREIALKVLRHEVARDERALAAFVNEAKLLRRIEHDGVVRCFGVARAGDVYFTRLELIDGPSLQEELDRGRTFGEDEAFAIVLGVARSLAHLAELGLVHRDVKPGNVLVASDGRPVLIDLGFAAAAGEENFADSAIGTVAYLSPEQARGGARADIRSDVYSLGVSMFQLVVGRLPFVAADDREVLALQVLASLESPELKRRGISPHLHYFVQKTMSKDPEHRYQSWNELITDVERLLEGRAGIDWRAGEKPSPRAAARRARRRRRP